MNERALTYTNVFSPMTKQCKNKLTHTGFNNFENEDGIKAI